MKQRTGKRAPPNARRQMKRRFALLLVLAAVGAVAVLGARKVFRPRKSEPDRAAEYHPRPPGQLTFNREIAPIIYGNCAICHRPGQAGPFSLLSYREVKDHAPDIVKVTASRFMPPWLPEHDRPAMAGERRLTPDQIGVIQQWVAEGAAEGSPGDHTPAPTWATGWQLGTPDLVAELPEAYTLPADGRDVYRNFVIPLPLSQRRLVRALEFSPNTKVLHHVFIRFDRTRQSRRRDAEDLEVGFGGMALPPSVEAPGGYFLSWQPGRGPTHFPPGLAWAIEPGSDLILQAHMQPSGKPEPVRPRIGFYFTDVAPTNTPSKLVLSSLNIDIPAGARNYEIRDSYVLPVDADLLAVLPHAHYLAREMRGLAVLPNGETRPLLNIRDWDFNWQSDYQYAEPIHLPKGTRLEMKFTYDNSSQNVRNPHQPPEPVSYGVRSTDEMGELWFQMLMGNANDRRTLEDDYARRLVQEAIDYNTLMLRQNPSNAHAHVQLAKALINLNRSGDAFTHLRRAIEIDPNEEEGHYHLGVLAMNTDPISAEPEFMETIRINPENFKARNNLGLILMNSGRYADAEVQFRAALALRPTDRIVIDNLNLLRQRAGRP
ncbi:MAG: hypothetical protein QOF48_1619 [Verrucomicrobiota bacterium]|jgi:mono/diheme cytochrome c family protein